MRGLALFAHGRFGRCVLAPLQYLAVEDRADQPDDHPAPLAHADRPGAWLPRHRAWRDARQASAAARLQPRLLDRHHGARSSSPTSASSPSRSLPAGRSSARWRGCSARSSSSASASGTSGEQASELAARLAAGDAMVLFAEGSTSRRQSASCRSRARCSAPPRWRSRERRGRKGLSSSRWPSPTRACMACRWAASTAPLAAWIGDSDLVPHLAALLREGAIDVEVHFGEPVEFNARQRPQGGDAADGGRRCARWCRPRCATRAGRPR